MDPRLTILLEIQDLKEHIRDLAFEPAAASLQSEQFNLDVDEAIRTLESKVVDLAGGLDPQLRKRFERIAATMERVVVPVINGVCYGCYVSIATATAIAQGPRPVRSCESCGRFIYVLS
jgi:predicted  nucleic acid-binding Zn-ribbon protein